jgi:molecular chaperone GrpE
MSHSKPSPDTPPETPAPVPEPTPPTPPAIPSEVDALKDRLLRLQADFDNFRKRTARERGELRTAANEEFFRELLPVLDHFDLGLKTAAQLKTDPAVQHGFQMVHDQFAALLRKFGLTPLDVHEGHFDPHLHEAVSHVPSDEYAADEIVEQTRRGYRIGEKLLRPVQVVVSSGPGAPRDDEVRAEAAPPDEAGEDR